jgi:hypothetical protein
MHGRFGADIHKVSHRNTHRGSEAAQQGNAGVRPASLNLNQRTLTDARPTGEFIEGYFLLLAIQLNPQRDSFIHGVGYRISVGH